MVSHIGLVGGQSIEVLKTEDNWLVINIYFV